MNRITPAVAGIATALIIAPLAALGASGAGIIDQAMAWVVTLLATAATSAIAAVVARLVGVTLDARARETIQIAMERAARLGLEWVLDEARDTPIGQRIETASRQMLPYLDAGAAESLKRFGMHATGDGGQHLQDMAKAELIKQVAAIAPDRLTKALAAAGALGGR